MSRGCGFYVETIMRAILEKRPVLVYTAAGSEEVCAYDEGVSIFIASIAEMLSTRMTLPPLILAGGETSSAVCRSLGIYRLQMRALGEKDLLLCHGLAEGRLFDLAIKCGQLGDVDYFLDASRRLLIQANS